MSAKCSQDQLAAHSRAGREQLLRWILENERQLRLKRAITALAARAGLAQHSTN